MSVAEHAAFLQRTQKEFMEKDSYNFSTIKCPIKLTASYILSRVSDTQIIWHYIGRVQIGRAIKNPFRTDKTPSATFFIGDSGDLCLWDFRDKRVWNCFQIVMSIFNCDFNKALTQIAEDFGLIDIKTRKVSSKLQLEAAELDQEYRKGTLIQFTHKSWEKGIGKPLSYWQQYEITVDELRRERVFCVDRLFINKKEIINTTNEPRFVYLEKDIDGKDLVKVYLPYAKGGQKWYSNVPLTTPFGFQTLPMTDKLVVPCKSKKDEILIKRIFPECFSVQNESRGAFSKEVLDIIDRHYDRVMLIFGSDPHALQVTKEICEEMGPKWGFFHTPIQDYERHQIEDPAGFVKMYGFDELTTLFDKANLLT